MSESLDFNPALPESRQFTSPAEGGNGKIHKPGDYRNLIWQTVERKQLPGIFAGKRILRTQQ